MLRVNLIAGRDKQTEALVTDLEGRSRAGAVALQLARPGQQAEARRLLRHPCDVLVLSGHGYGGSDEDPLQWWALAGTSRWLLHSADFLELREPIPAGLLVFDACNVGRFREFWELRVSPGTTVVHGSQGTNDPNAVRAAQWQRLRPFFERAAAMRLDCWTPADLRAAWDAAQADGLEMPSVPRYLVWARADSAHVGG